MSNSPVTIGLEFESVMCTREEMNSLVTGFDNKIKQITRDASVESTMALLNSGFKVLLGTSFARDGFYKHNRVVSGYEIVTEPLSIEEARDVIERLVNIQVKAGEIHSDRSSIHIHLGFPQGLIFYKTVIALGLKVEPLLYKIAGMGNEFRGQSNHAAYCRPLAHPPAVRVIGGDSLFVLNPAASVTADGMNGFWGCFGINPGSRERYNPLRYFGINVFSIMLRGTLEFRFFNFCSVARYIEAAVALCQLIAELMQRVPLEVIEDEVVQLSIFHRNTDREYKELFYSLVKLGERYDVENKISDEDIENIIELISVTPQPMFDSTITRSHITTPQFSKFDAIRYGLIPIVDAPEPGIVDIHTFENEDRHLLPILEDFDV